MDIRARLRSSGVEALGPRIAERQPRRKPLPLGHWGLAVTGTGQVRANGVVLEELIETHGSPLHVVLGSRLASNIEEAMAPAKDGTGADVFYSYKTNPIPGVLEQLHEGGVGAEVISEYEFWLARELGVPGDRIIYNGPAKSPESIAEAIRQNTLLINANSVSDLMMIAEQAAQVGKAANAGIRVALPGGWAGQFGLGWDTSEFVQMVRYAIDSSDLNLIGLHSHRGITMRTRDDAIPYVDTVLDFADSVHRETNWYPEILDLGGSLGCPTSAGIPAMQYRLNRALATDVLPPDPTDCIRVGEFAREAYQRCEQRARQKGLPAPRVVLEPGRALTADTQLLLTSILDLKTDGQLPHAIVDAGVNIAESVTNEYHQIVPLADPHGPADSSYRIAGPICTPADVLYNNWRLPEPQVGDVLAIMDTGAYCVPFSTSFSFPRPAIVRVDDGDATVLRRAETFQDLVLRDEVRPRGVIDLNDLEIADDDQGAQRDSEGRDGAEGRDGVDEEVQR